MVFDVAIIGAGAAGYFTAINLKLHNENLKVVILEKSNKTLSKVKISGGGRCNVTHYQLNPSLLAANYPRGEKFLKRAFKLFNVQDTIQWFENHGVNLVVEADGRMFPKSNSSETIINLFESLAQKLGIEVWIQSNVVEISESKINFIPSILQIMNLLNQSMLLFQLVDKIKMTRNECFKISIWNLCLLCLHCLRLISLISNFTS